MALELPLTAVHRAAGADLGEAWGIALPRRFTDPLAEQRAARESVVLIDTSYRGVVDLSGESVAECLHGIFSSHPKELSVGEGQPAVLMTAKGRLVAAFHLFALEGGTFRLVFAEPPTENALRSIQRYTLLSDIEMTLRSELASEPATGDAASSGFAVLSLQGPAVAPLWEDFGAGALPGRTLTVSGGVVAGVQVDLCRGGDTPAGGVDLWVPRAELKKVWDELARAVREMDGALLGHEAHEALRIEAGRARRGYDYDEESFPNEVRWEHSLTYDKCYVGQEIVARMRTYGQVHRRLKGVLLAGAAVPAAGAKLYSGDDAIGHVTSAAFSGRLERPIAMALIRRKSWKLEAAEVALSDTERAPVELVELPLVELRGSWVSPAPEVTT